MGVGENGWMKRIGDGSGRKLEAGGTPSQKEKNEDKR